MSRQFKNGKCSCWDRLNKILKGHNAELDISFNFIGEHFLNITTNKINSRLKGNKKRVFASFCPFCGCKLKRKHEKEKQATQKTKRNAS